MLQKKLDMRRSSFPHLLFQTEAKWLRSEPLSRNLFPCSLWGLGITAWCENQHLHIACIKPEILLKSKYDSLPQEEAFKATLHSNNPDKEKLLGQSEQGQAGRGPFTISIDKVAKTTLIFSTEGMYWIKTSNHYPSQEDRKHTFVFMGGKSKEEEGWVLAESKDAD